MGGGSDGKPLKGTKGHRPPLNAGPPRDDHAHSEESSE